MSRWLSPPSCDAVASASSSSSIAKLSHAPVRHERQRLQRLDRRARERDQLGIAERVDDAAVTVDDGRGDEMPGVDAVAARDHDRGGRSGRADHRRVL